jgi:hypothetical protein
MLAKADPQGFVEAALPGLARLSNLPTEQVESALQVLESPDPHSKDLEENPENEGKRILKVPGGWVILNYENYRNRRDDQQRREYMRTYMVGYRKEVKQRKQNVNSVNRSKPQLAQAEAEAEAEADSKSTRVPAGNSEHKAFIDGWCQNFRAAHGFDYVFSGGRDGKAVKSLLSLGILRIDLLEIAKSAWSRSKEDSRAWNCAKAATISGFKDYLNQIRTELNNGATHQRHSPENPRNFGTCKGVTDYGEAAKRRAAEGLVKKMVAAPNEPPPTTAGT